MTKPTQRERVLKMLRAGPVCGTTLLEAHIPRYAAVVYELRTKSGRAIITKPCTRPGHQHESPQIEYQLVDASHSLGSNNDKVPAPTPPAAEKPDRDGEATTDTLFDLEDTARGPDPWLNT